jgi:hypothetical protein
MTVIELPDEEAALLTARAAAEGMPLTDWLSKLAGRENKESAGTPVADDTDDRPISEVIAEIMADVPPDVLARLPKDGASQHDHYIYGWPKRDV